MPLDLSSIQALCFDVDGTLRDTDDQFVQNLETLLRPLCIFFPGRDPHGASFSALVARKLVMAMEDPGTFLYGLSDRLQVDGLLARLSGYVEARNVGRKPALHPLIPGVGDMLSALSPHYPLAIVSARNQASTLAFLDAHGLRRFFQVIVTGQTCRYTKPHPQPVLFAARRMGVAPENCLMIGDTTADIRSGRRAGAQTVGVLCGFGERQELEREGANLILASTPEILGVLADK